MRAVIVGGFTTSLEGLRPVVSAVERLDIADEIEVFPFLYAMKRPNEVRKAVENALVIAHSAGILAVDTDTRPQELVACNGPEVQARWALRLGAGALRKMQNTRLFAADPEHPARYEYARISGDNMREGLRHPLGYSRRIAQVARFSTAAHLADAIESERIATATALVTPDDEFFPHVPESLDYGKATVLTHTGNHDALLASPDQVLQVWLGASGQST